MNAADRPMPTEADLPWALPEDWSPATRAAFLAGWRDGADDPPLTPQQEAAVKALLIPALENLRRAS